MPDTLSAIQQLELIERAVSFDPRRKRDERETQGLIANLFQVLGARAVAAHGYLSSRDDTQEHKDYKNLVAYHNELLKQILAIP